MNKYLNLLRVQQWYKNLLVYLAIFFSANFINGHALLLTTIAFFSLSFMSSAGYIINDLIDIKRDRAHPEKRLRPLAAKLVKKPTAIVISIILLIASLALAYYIGGLFFYFPIMLFGITLIYTFVLKNIIFADILTIAVLFVLRAIAGAFVISVFISPWLILCPFFLSIFLSVGKRHADLILLQNKAKTTREILNEYTPTLTNSLMTIATTLLVISYALYSFLSEQQNLLYTLPFALFVIFCYYHLILNGSIIARHPHKMIHDKAMIIGIILWVVITAIIIYV